VRSNFLDLIKNPVIKLRKVNLDEKPSKPPPKATPGNHMDDLMVRIRERREAMDGKDTQKRRELLDLPPKPEAPAVPAGPGETVTGDNGLVFGIKEDSGAGSTSASSQSSDW
jgi:hypothetical protein